MSSDATLSSGVAGRYANAFFELMVQNDALETAEKDLLTLEKAIEESADLRDFLKSPLYSNQDQAKAIEALADKAGFAPLSKNFLGLLAGNRRLFALDTIIIAFKARLAQHRGEVNAEAISASPLNADQARRLRSEIETIVGKAVNLETRVDPELLGGMIVKVGSRMIDSSLKTKLNRLQTVMKEA